MTYSDKVKQSKELIKSIQSLKNDEQLEVEYG